MVVTQRLRKTLQLMGLIALASAVLGSFFGWFIAELNPWGFARGAIEGFLIAASIVAFELGYVRGRAGRWIRRLPMIAALFLKVLAYTVIIVVCDTLAGLSMSGTPADTRLQFNLGFLYVVLFSMAGATAANFVIAVNQMLGGSALANLFTGRYHNPREEERVFMFLDVVGSTGIAEKIGAVRFHAFLNQIVFDFTEPIIENGGDIYRYVGDEIIATWPLRKEGTNAGPLKCYAEGMARLAAAEQQYRDAFGEAPRLRAAFHAGRVVIGEMGDYRREITMLGDAVNTTARIEQACRDTGQDAIMSDAYMRNVTLPPGFETVPLGPVPLRGKRESLDLYGLKVRSQTNDEER